jgi:hypothetical protein
VRAALATGLGLALFGGVALGQFNSAASAVSGGAGSASSAIFKGTVLNHVTRAPVGRALVLSADQQLATMTDDRGRFELRTGAAGGGDSGNDDSTNAFNSSVRTAALRYFQVRKPGYLDSGQTALRDDGSSAGDVTIYLKPEALIVGKIISGDAEHVLRFQVQLYKQEFRQGQEHWQQAGHFMTWSDGEFRFAGLAAGTYKIVSTEQMDQEFQFGRLRGQEFGYPATFYPGVADFASANAIRIATGETFEANFTVTRRPYHAVRIPVANAPGAEGANLVVYPLGRPGPGFSLGYDQSEQAIVGLLPDGEYTVSAESYAPSSAAGTTNLSVKGEAAQGASLHMVENGTVVVKVRELFRNTDNGSQQIPRAGLDLGASRANNPRLQLELDPAEDFGLARPQNSRPVGDSANSLEIAGTVPGKYAVRASPTEGYAASVLYGGVELLRQPLVVGLGGISSPIEVTLRDDGAQVQGEVEDDETAPVAANGPAAMKPPRFLHFVPMPGSTGQYRETSSNSEGAFIESQLPPGDYLVLAFSGGDPNLQLSFADAIAKYSAVGQVIGVAPEQKLQLRLKAIAEDH